MPSSDLQNRTKDIEVILMFTTPLYLQKMHQLLMACTAQLLMQSTVMLKIISFSQLS